MGSKRFYVGNLSNDVKETDVDKLFKKFGDVEKVEIKSKTDIDGNVLTTFAFVSLKDLTENDVVQCIQKLNNSVWKKSTIKVQQAQESFLSRLKKEREEAAKPIEKSTKPVLVSEPFDSGNNKRKTFSDDYDPMDIIKRSVGEEDPAKRLEAKKQREFKVAQLNRNNPTEKSSVRADDKAVISFDDDLAEAKNSVISSRLERKERARVYYSSSDDDDDDEGVTKAKKSKTKSKSGDILRKLETLDGGFWKDEEVSIEPIPKIKEAENDTKEETTLTKDSFGQTNSFSLLSAFGNKKEEVIEKETKMPESFAMKLKEKVAIDGSKGQGESFFLDQNDKRWQEAVQFLELNQSMTQVRTNYEEKRPVLASIMKKKLKNRAKKKERMTFGTVKGKRKFGSKTKKRGNKA